MNLKTFNIYHNENKAVRDAYDMLTAKIHFNRNEKKIKSFLITSCKPQEGKTSLAISLAVSIANSGWNVLLIDADMRKPTSAKRLSQNTQLGLSEYLANKIGLNEALSETNVSNLTYLSSGIADVNQVEILCSARFKEMLQQVQSRYDFVLFDSPALESVVDASIVATNVDATILVVETGLTSMKSLKRAKEQLENMNAKIMGIVLNKMKKSAYKRYFSSYNYFSPIKKRLFSRKKAFIPVDGGISKNQ